MWPSDRLDSEVKKDQFSPFQLGQAKGEISAVPGHIIKEALGLRDGRILTPGREHLLKFCPLAPSLCLNLVPALCEWGIIHHLDPLPLKFVPGAPATDVGNTDSFQPSFWALRRELGWVCLCSDNSQLWLNPLLRPHSCLPDAQSDFIRFSSISHFAPFGTWVLFAFGPSGIIPMPLTPLPSSHSGVPCRQGNGAARMALSIHYAVPVSEMPSSVCFLLSSQSPAQGPAPWPGAPLPSHDVSDPCSVLFFSSVLGFTSWGPLQPGSPWM